MKRMSMIGGVGVAAAVVIGAMSAPRAQAPTPVPATAARAFEVASVKVNKGGEGPSSIRALPGGTLTVTNNTLRNIVRNAYGVTNYQMVGGPSWFDSDRFDIIAKANAPFDQPQGMAMVRTLLEDRFKLVAHMETREMPIYALVMARSDGRPGAQLRPATVDCDAVVAAVRAGGPMPGPGPGGRPVCGIRVQFGTVVASGVSMEQFARNLAGGVGRVVMEKTGLRGNWDLDVTFTPDQAPPTLPPGVPGPPPADPNGPSLFTALQEQLGLKLEAQRGPIEVLVVDRAEQPTAD